MDLADDGVGSDTNNYPRSTYRARRAWKLHEEGRPFAGDFSRALSELPIFHDFVLLLRF
jgi:hypothetical protein